MKSLSNRRCKENAGFLYWPDNHSAKWPGVRPSAKIVTESGTGCAR
jgi:hypothetical protein